MVDTASDKSKDITAINELYERWRTAWLTVDVDGMVSLFDKEFEGLVYQAEEIEHGIIGYEGIVEYWRNTKKVMAAVKEWRDVVPKRVIFVTPVVAFVWAEVMSALNATFIPKDIWGVLRCTIGLHKKSNGQWAIIHYHESRHLLISQNPQGAWTFLPDVTLR